MGQIICDHMVNTGVPLDKPLFTLGNLMPDILLTYIFNRHAQPRCSSRLRKLLKRLHETSPSSRLMFSYYSGVATHYICDFLCYAHTSAFKGGLRDHHAYEKSQTCIGIEILPLNKQYCMNYYSLAELINALEERISGHVQALSENAGKPSSDIPVAINTASWAASAAYSLSLPS